jgi:hypothetical protein
MGASVWPHNSTFVAMLALRLFTSTELVGCAWFTGGDQQLR